MLGVAPSVRVAGCLLLIFAQPLSRIATLTVDDVDDHRRPVRIRLGRDPLELPEPLGTLAAELKHRQPGLATTAAGGRSRWLFPGLRLDAPIHHEHLRRRLRRLGISARTGPRGGADAPRADPAGGDPRRPARDLPSIAPAGGSGSPTATGPATPPKRQCGRGNSGGQRP